MYTLAKLNQNYTPAMKKVTALQKKESARRDRYTAVKASASFFFSTSNSRLSCRPCTPKTVAQQQHTITPTKIVAFFIFFGGCASSPARKEFIT
jgi:hypothetical protein